MGLFDVLNGIVDILADNSGKTSNEMSSRESSAGGGNLLEKRREEAINYAKQEIYNGCFEDVTRRIPEMYAANRKEYCGTFGNPTNISIDMDTLHKVIKRATHDAIKAIGLAGYSEPTFAKSGSSAFTVFIHWR